MPSTSNSLIQIIIRAKDEATATIRAVQAGMKDLTEDSSGSFDDFGKGLEGLKDIQGLLVGFGAAVVTTFTGAVAVAAGFEDSMAKVGAVTDATTEDFSDLSEEARRLGSITRYSALEVAEGMKFMGMAGMETDQILGAMENTLQLAQAGALDLGEAADITTNILSGMGLAVEDLAHVNDVLVKAFTSTNSTLQEIGEAMKYVAPIARGVGAEFEELTATAGLLHNAGIKASMAGTSLRGAISALMNPTKDEAKLMEKLAERLGKTELEVRKADGTFVGFIDIVRQLEEAGVDGAEALELFGLRAGPAMAALIDQGADKLERLTEELRKADGTTEEISARMNDTLIGALKEVFSAIQEGAITIGGPFLKALAQLLRFLAMLINLVTGFIKILGPVGPILISLVVGIGSLTLALGLLSLAWNTLGVKSFVVALRAAIVTMATGTTTATGLAGALTAVKVALMSINPIIAVIGLAVATLTAMLIGHARAWRGMAEEAKKAREESSNIRGTLDDLVGAYRRAADGSDEQKIAAAALQEGLEKLAKENASLGDQARKAADAIDLQTGAFKDNGAAIKDLNYAVVQKQMRALALEAKAMSAELESAFGMRSLVESMEDFNAMFLAEARSTLNLFTFGLYEYFSGDDYEGLFGFIDRRLDEIDAHQQKVFDKTNNWVKNTLREMVELGKVDPTMPLREFEVYIKSLGAPFRNMSDLFVMAFSSMQASAREALNEAEGKTRSLTEEQKRLTGEILEQSASLAQLKKAYEEAAEAAKDTDNTEAINKHVKAYGDLQQALKRYEADVKELAQVEIKLAQETANAQVAEDERSVKLGLMSKEAGELRKIEIEAETARKIQSFHEQTRDLIAQFAREGSEEYKSAFKAAEDAAQKAAEAQERYAEKARDTQVQLLAEFKDKAKEAYRSFYEAAKDAYSRAVDEAEKWADKVKDAQRTAAEGEEDFQRTIREIRRKGMTEAEAQIDRRLELIQELDRLQSEFNLLGKDATAEDFNRIANEARSLQREIAGIAQAGNDNIAKESQRFAAKWATASQALWRKATSASEKSAKEGLEGAIQKAEKLKEVLDNIDQQIRIGIEIKDGAGALEVLRNLESIRKQAEQISPELAEKMKLPELRLVISPESLAEADAEIQGLFEKFKGGVEVDGPIVKINLADMSGEVDAQVTAIQERLAQVDLQLRASADPALQSIQKVRSEYEGAFLSIQNKPVQIKAKDEASLIINGIRQEISKLPTSKTITVTVRRITQEAKRLGGLVGYALGGLLPGWGGGDRISALLEAGEYVVRKEAVRAYGAPFFEALNAMRLSLPRMIEANNRFLPRVPAGPRLAYQTGGPVSGFSLKDMGTVKIEVGGRQFPVMARTDVVGELKEAIKKEKLRRGNG